jgi:hypothetical protein
MANLVKRRLIALAVAETFEIHVIADLVQKRSIAVDLLASIRQPVLRSVSHNGHAFLAYHSHSLPLLGCR